MSECPDTFVCLRLCGHKTLYGWMDWERRADPGFTFYGWTDGYGVGRPEWIYVGASAVYTVAPLSLSEIVVWLAYLCYAPDGLEEQYEAAQTWKRTEDAALHDRERVARDDDDIPF